MSTQTEHDRKAPPWTARNDNGYEAPVGVTADPVVLTVRERELVVLLVPRPEDPKILAVPGGFVGPDESGEQTVMRKLEEKTGLRGIYFEQLGSFTDPHRDWRGWIPTAAFLALVPPATTASEPGATWVPARKPPELAFDHNAIVQLAIERVIGKLWWSNIAAGILAEPFTMAEAQDVYEAISGRRYDPRLFGRDLRATGLVRPTGELRPTGGRPAQLYEFVATDQLLWGEGRKKRASV